MSPKSTLLIVFLLGYMLSLSAQKNSFEKLTQQACDCLAATIKVDENDIAYWEQKVDSCMHLALIQHLGGLMVEKIVDVNDKAQLQDFGEKWGQKLYTDCAAYRDYWDFRAKAELKVKQSELPTIVGKITRIERSENGTRIVFWLQLPTMQLFSFHWLREFDGSARFFNSDNQNTAYLGKYVRITWENTAIYNPQKRKYETFREIKLIDELSNSVNPTKINPTSKWAKLKRKQAKLYQKKLRSLRIRQAQKMLKAAKRDKY